MRILTWLTPQTLARWIMFSLFTTVLAGMWDIWWHGMIGRDSFWEPPHLLLYASILVSILGGVYGWYRFKEKVWTHVGMALSSILISAPIDEYWHRTFGIEDVSSPLIVWSPPHLILVGAVALSFMMLLPIVRRETDSILRTLLFGMSFAGILALLLFPITPLEPLGVHRMLGYWGAGVMTFVITAVMLFGQEYMSGLARISVIAVFFLLISSIAAGGEGVGVPGIPPHPHSPYWVTVFALLMPSVVIDILARYALLVRGVLFGGIYASIFYVVSNFFIETQFRFSSGESVIAVLAGSIGGLVAAFVVSRILQYGIVRKETI